MIINNYNNSNSGIDIEFELVKDVTEADYRVRAAENGYNDDFALGLYADNGGSTRLIVFYADQAEKTTPYFTKTALRSIKRDQLAEMAKDFFGYGYYYENKQDLINDLLNITKERFYNQAANFIERFLKDDEVDFKVYGNVQGEFSSVVVTKACKRKNQYINNHWAENLLYKVPVIGSINIATDDLAIELDAADLLDNDYQYCKETLIKNTIKATKLWAKDAGAKLNKKMQTQLSQFLNENVPYSLSWRG